MKQVQSQTCAEAERGIIAQHDPAAASRFAPAYNFGWSQRLCRGQVSWDEVETQLRDGWSRLCTNNGLSWAEARAAIRDGWDHVSPEQRCH